MSTAYANLVCHYLKQPKEAFAFLEETVMQMPEDYPIINESCYDATMFVLLLLAAACSIPRNFMLILVFVNL